LGTAEDLDDDPEITYTLFLQLAVDFGDIGNYVNVNEITDIRCDGLVEYAYEWNGLWIWGQQTLLLLLEHRLILMLQMFYRKFKFRA
jgi:hypothetical protein